jgi:hypothetical protein
MTECRTPFSARVYTYISHGGDRVAGGEAPYQRVSHRVSQPPQELWPLCPLRLPTVRTNLHGDGACHDDDARVVDMIGRWV